MMVNLSSGSPRSLSGGGDGGGGDGGGGDGGGNLQWQHGSKVSIGCIEIICNRSGRGN